MMTSLEKARDVEARLIKFHAAIDDFLESAWSELGAESEKGKQMAVEMRQIVVEYEQVINMQYTMKRSSDALLHYMATLEWIRSFLKTNISIVNQQIEKLEGDAD